MSCPVCYDDFTQDNQMVVCWNEHSLCQGCYSTMMNDSRSQNKKCAECRVDMFDWREPTNTITALLPNSNRTYTRRRQRCGICRQEGHNRTSCQDPRAVQERLERQQRRQEVEAERQRQEAERERQERHRRFLERTSFRTHAIQRYIDSLD